MILAFSHTASAYTLEATPPSEELVVGTTLEGELLVTVGCEEIQTYGTPGSDSVRFSVAAVPAEGIRLELPETIQIPRGPCSENPQGDTTFTLPLPFDAAPEAQANRPLVNSIEVLPFDDANGFGVASSEPERQPPVEVTVQIAYFADVAIEITEPLIKDTGAWFQVDLTCACNAPTLVEFSLDSPDRHVSVPTDIVLGRAGTVDEYERTLVYIEPKGFGPEGATWSFTATYHAQGDASAVGGSTSFSVTVPPQTDVQETPFPTGLGLLAVGIAAARRR